MKKILSIGGGGAGMFSLITASQLKKNKFEITVLSDEKDIYCRCSTPYIFTKGTDLKEAIQPDSLVSDYNLKIVREKALALNTSKREVTTNKGNIFSYDYLVIATGASPFKPNLPGIDLPGVYTVRTSDDAKNIQASLKKAKKAIVIGAGVIGIEMAGAFRQNGLEVSIIERMPSLASDIFDKEYALKLINLLKNKGIKFYFDSTLKEIKKSTSTKQTEITPKEINIIHKGKEKILTADIIVLAIGVRANLDIIKNTPIKAIKEGIAVNNKMQTNINNIYACGDCSLPLYAPTGKFIPSRLSSSAIQQSKIVGFQIAGYPIKYNGSTGAFAFETLGKQYAGVGLNEVDARKHFRWVVIGRAETTGIYKDMKKAQPLEIKLIFAGPKMRLVGYEGFGQGVIASAELASFAIGLKLSILSMLKFNYISHPSMTSWPFMDPIIMATEDAMNTITKKIKHFFGR